MVFPAQIDFSDIFVMMKMFIIIYSDHLYDMQNIVFSDEENQEPFLNFHKSKWVNKCTNCLYSTKFVKQII